MPDTPPAVRDHAYAEAYALLRAAAASDPGAFDAAFARALDRLATAFPDEVPTVVETLMAYSVSLGHIGRPHLSGYS